MRLQIFIPALCLLTVLFMTPCLGFTVKKTPSPKTKTTLNKVVKSHETETMKFSEAAINHSVKMIVAPPVAAGLSIDSSPFENSSFTTINEVGTISASNGSSESITSNAQVPNMISNAIFFQRGMYYGFAIMVILLNLVCFLLFEEKVFLFYSLALTAVTATFFYSDSLFAVLGLDMIENTLGYAVNFITCCS